jgi:hypothetical protein
MKLQRKTAGIIGALLIVIVGVFALAAPASAGTYAHPVVNNSNYCLDVPNFSTQAGTQLILSPCNGGANQNFLFEDADGAWLYYIHPSHNRSMCLVPGNASLMNSTIIQWPCDRGMRQKWYLGFGAYDRILVDSYSGWCAGVDYAYSGAYVTQGNCKGPWRIWSLP